MLIEIQPDATVCRYLFTAKLLYMFRVSQRPLSGVLKTVNAASGTGHNIGTDNSLQRGLIRPRWRELSVSVLWPVQKAAVTVFSTPDDGCCDTWNMWSDSAVNKYLHTVASGRIFINTESSNTEHTPCGHEVFDRAVNKQCLVRGTGAVLRTGWTIVKCGMWMIRIIIVTIWQYNPLWVFAFSAKSLQILLTLAYFLPLFNFQLF